MSQNIPIIFFLLSWFLSTSSRSHQDFFQEETEGKIFQSQRYLVSNVRNKRASFRLDEAGKSHGQASTTTTSTPNKWVIPANYSMNELPPTKEGEEVIVQVSALVMDVRDVDEIHEHISMELKLKIFWLDKRLRNRTDNASESDTDYVILNPSILEQIWHPDIYIEHVKSIDHPAILSKPSSLRLYPNGMLRFSIRMTVTVVCPMDFRYYPVDTQLCHIDLQSYAFQSHLIFLQWDPDFKTMLLNSAKLSNFELDMGHSKHFKLSSMAGGDYIGLRFTLILRRNLSYHLLQTYLPSVLYILVSWLSFILPLNSASERMGYCMTCLFTLTSMFGSVRQSTPNVSYVKAIDVWMVVCIFFVFLTLLQHALISKFRRKKLRNSENEPKKNENELSTNLNHIPNSNSTDEMETSFCTRRESPKNGESTAASIEGLEEQTNKFKTISTESILRNNDISTTLSPTFYQRITKKIDKYLSFIIPTLFLLFNLVYWTFLISVKVKSYNDNSSY